jgi:DNA-binding transcriptional LysR family regulator
MVDDARLAHAAALSRAGIARFAEDYVASDLATGRLHPVLSDWASPLGGLRIYYAGRTAAPALQAFVAFLRDVRTDKDGA